MRFFLAAQRSALPGHAVEQPGLLHDGAAGFQDLDLAAGFVVDGLLHEADGVHVLGLGARAQGFAGAAHREVHVGPHRALGHVAVAAAEIAQNRPQLGEVGPGFLGRTHVRLGDDLHQGHAAAVQIDEGHLGMPVVQRLAGVLLQVQALDPDLAAGAVCQVDDDGTFAHDRLVVLADLIAGR